jgi:hypothetical protein
MTPLLRLQHHEQLIGEAPDASDDIAGTGDDYRHVTAMTRLAQIVIITLTLSVLACSDQGSAVSPVNSGSYKYTAHDTSGVTIVQGWFSLVAHDTSSFTGEWHFSAVGNPTNTGPQIGDGTLVGGIRDGGLWIELRPEYRDNNVMLSSKVRGESFSGTWEWISFVGITARGTFTATKI